MKYSGCNPFTDTLHEKCLASTLIVYNMCTFILQTIFLVGFTTNYNDISALVLDVVGYSAYWQINYKLYSCLTKKKILVSLYNKMINDFWSADECSTPKQRNKIEELYKLTKMISKIFGTSIFCTLFGYILTSPAKNEHHLVNNIWLPEFIARHKMYLGILTLVQIYGMGVSTMSGLLPFDLFFLTSIANGIAQLKIIKYKLLTIGTTDKKTEDDYSIIIKCVNHHNLLFEYFNEIEIFSSAAVLHMLGTNTVLGVVILFVFLVEENISQLIAYVFIMISVVGQFYMYCLMGQFIQTETAAVADAAYGSSWENVGDYKVRMGILRIIQRSHKYARISMGGFLILCLENFTRVARMMLSVLTLIVNMRNQ